MNEKRKIKGRYEILENIGRGGMGLVYRAYDNVAKREVALKIIREVPNTTALDLFRKECGIMAAMSHPNIVEIFDIGEFEENGSLKPYFVMPLLPGVTLDDLIRNSSRRLTVKRAVDIILQTCRGLQAAHKKDLIHRDLKPRNIFVMPDHSVKIIDFGVAHMVDTRTSLSIKGGTLPYLAPEQIEMKPATPLSDIFSLGVVFYETVTRRRPFDFPTEQEIIQAILRYSPPSASEINPEVSPLISRIIHKAMAKQPWNRFSSALELAETLQKVQRNEAIEIFDSARIQPRIQRASKAFEQGNYQFAMEILSELESEGHLEPAISTLRRQLNQAVYQKRVTELLDSARNCFEEEEYVLAMQKVQEVLQMERNNSTARTLKASIENRLNDQKIEEWTKLARQHLENNAFTHAREALQNLLQLRPKDATALQLLSEVDRCEQQYVQARQEKERLYQAALEAWKNGEMSAALTKMERVIELDRRVPDTSAPDRGISYQNYYDQIRSEHDAARNAYQEASKHLRDGNFTAAQALCEENLTRHPGHALFQALKFDIQERQRQELSARIAEIDRRVETEPDLDRRVNILREALEQYPGEPHFERALRLMRDKRDMVSSIVAKARAYEERGQFNEALERWETLRAIHKQQPGLDFEIDRVFKRRDQQFRSEAKARWIEQTDRQLEAHEYARALEILKNAMNEFPGDAELASLETLAHQGQARALKSQQLLAQGIALREQGEVGRGLECLREAWELDEHDPAISAAYVEALLSEARARLDQDWNQAEALCQQALAIDPSNALARSLQTLALDRKQEEFVGRCASEARRLQAAGNVQAALDQVEQGLAAYPREQRLLQLQNTLRRALAEPSRVSSATPSQPAPPVQAPQEIRPKGWTELEQRLQGPHGRVEEPPPTLPSPPAAVASPPSPNSCDAVLTDSTKTSTQAAVPLMKRLSDTFVVMSRAGPLVVGMARRVLASIRATAVGKHVETARSRQHRGGSPEMPVGAIDRVHFTITSPRSAQPGDIFELYIWAHLERHREIVICRAQEALGQSSIGIKSKGPVHVARGATLSVHLNLNGMVVDDPDDMILWEGDIGNAIFLIRIPHSAKLGTYSGLATIRANGCEIAKIHFTLQVGRFTLPFDAVASEERRHRRAFASYATQDRNEVLARVQGIQKAAPELEVFLDVISLRSGRYWEEELKRTIPKSDIFYLFWSRYARDSSWVEKEWRCAFETRGLDFIDPVPLVPPEEAPPPPELAGKHFNDPVLHFFRRNL